MIPLIATESLSSIEISQLERIQLARGSWSEGQLENAFLILESVKVEEMSGRVSAEVFVAEAAFRAEALDFAGSLESLASAARFIESAPRSVQGAFYHQRARAHKERGDLGAAFVDYAGAEIAWSEIGAVEKLGAVLLNLAGLCLASKDLQRAHDYCHRALDAFRQTNSFYISQAFDTQAKIFLAEERLGPGWRSISAALDSVGDNDLWKKDFRETKEKIENAITDLLLTAGLKIESVQLVMVGKALAKHDGNLTKAGQDVGLCRNAIRYIIDHNKELEHLGKKRRIRHKSVIKNI